MVGWRPAPPATLWATISEVRSRSGSMSCRLMVASASSGKLRMSPSRFLAKTVLPAPMKVIFGHAFVKSKIDNDPRLQVDFINPIMEQLARIMEKAGLMGSVSIIVNGYWRAWQKLRQLARARRKSSLNSFAAVSDMVSFRMVVRENDEKHATGCWPKSTAILGRFIDETSSTITLPTRKTATARCIPPPGCRATA
jgi:hypothetical protein